MQISATLIAAQQAAREAQAHFQAIHVAPQKASGTDFAAALEKESGFAPLPLKQTAPAATTPAPDVPNTRPGALLDIKI